MELNQQEHPVGMKFLGFRANYREQSLRDDDNDGLRRSAYAMIEERGDSSIPRGRRSTSGDLGAYEVLEYSPTGTYARIRELNRDGWNGTAPRDIGATETYGYWVTAMRYEVLERLP